jgi:hypothetical protein
LSDDPTRYHAFLVGWRAQRLGSLSVADVIRTADTLGTELSGAAVKAGLIRSLTAASRPYRSLAAYVRSLHDIEMQRR